MADCLSNVTHPIEPGQSVRFDPLVFPYAFSAAAYYYVIGTIDTDHCLAV